MDDWSESEWRVFPLPYLCEFAVFPFSSCIFSPFAVDNKDIDKNPFELPIHEIQFFIDTKRLNKVGRCELAMSVT